MAAAAWPQLALTRASGMTQRSISQPQGRRHIWCQVGTSCTSSLLRSHPTPAHSSTTHMQLYTFHPCRCCCCYGYHRGGRRGRRWRRHYHVLGVRLPLRFLDLQQQWGGEEALKTQQPRCSLHSKHAQFPTNQGKHGGLSTHRNDVRVARSCQLRRPLICTQQSRECLRQTVAATAQQMPPAASGGSQTPAPVCSQR